MSPNPALNPLLMKSIEIEYNATHLEKHELAQKHNIDLEDFLSASQDWTRNEEQTDIIIDAKPTDDIIPLPTQSAISTQSEEPNQSIPSNQVEVDDMILEIETTSKALLTKAQGMLKDYADDITPKDIKDMASAIQTIKDITIGRDITASTTINNNIVNQTNNIVEYARTKIQGTASDC